MEKLNSEIQKDLEKTNKIKERQIAEILSLDKSKMFEVKPKKKTSLLSKLRIIFGYGEKG